jgi:hypothetical protein
MIEWKNCPSLLSGLEERETLRGIKSNIIIKKMQINETKW